MRIIFCFFLLIPLFCTGCAALRSFDFDCLDACVENPAIKMHSERGGSSKAAVCDCSWLNK